VGEFADDTQHTVCHTLLNDRTQLMTAICPISAQAQSSHVHTTEHDPDTVRQTLTLLIEFSDDSTLSQLQRQSPDLLDMINYLEHGSLPSDQTSADSLVSDSVNWCLLNGILYHLHNPQKRNVKSVKPIIQQLAVPESLRPRILKAYYDDLGRWR